jgi:hypothetical protein
LESVIEKSIPEGVEYAVTDTTQLPSNRVFRGGWSVDIPNKRAVEDLEKCRVIAHDRRRAKRAEEFAPYDDIIMKQIPGTDTSGAESARAEIRTRYETMQNDIDTATDTAALRSILGL